MGQPIEFFIYNFTLTFLILGVLAAGIAVALKPGGFTLPNVAEALLAYFILFSIAASFFFNFVGHVFFGARAAAFIGWADSPFQAEVGYASLGYAAVGLVAFKSGLCVRLASILGPALFQWGAAVGHIDQILSTGNTAPGNAGVMLYSDIFLPVIGFALLWLKWKAGKVPTRTAMAAHAFRG
jgi:hypothetical protein